ncbi:MAG: sugar O-methyltransferase [Pseudomonadota bacterium]
MFPGHAAINYLASEAIKDDPNASSHWKKYHSEFKFTGQGFAGLQGFGGLEKRPTFLRRWFLLLLQTRFRRFGDAYAKFNTVDGIAREVTGKQQRAYDLDVLRQALTISFLHARVPRKFTENSTCCVVGDGFASLSTLLLASKLTGRVVLVNLTKTLLVDLWYLKLWMGPEKFETSVDLVVDEAGLAQALEKPQCASQGIAIEASHHQLIQSCPIDVVINIASMQEMDLRVVVEYFNDMRAIAVKRDLLFYCCNREEKELPDGVVTRFANYPWHADDQTLEDGPCPWHQYYYATRPPFYRPYDGPHMHRLVTLHANRPLTQ